jgi:hypothetical protein
MNHLLENIRKQIDARTAATIDGQALIRSDFAGFPQTVETLLAINKGTLLGLHSARLIIDSYDTNATQDQTFQDICDIKNG